MYMAAELLKQYADYGTGSVVGEAPQGAIALDYNPNSGNVFMTDESDNCYMLNDDGKVEQFITLETGRGFILEGFLSDLINMNENDWKGYDRSDRDQVDILRKEYSYLIKS